MQIQAILESFKFTHLFSVFQSQQNGHFKHEKQRLKCSKEMVFCLKIQNLNLF